MSDNGVRKLVADVGHEFLTLPFELFQPRQIVKTENVPSRSPAEFVIAAAFTCNQRSFRSGSLIS